MALQFPTASNVAVYLNGNHVNLAYRIDYRESHQKIPIYGYNDSHYSLIARSKAIIQGFLVINYVHPYYLAAGIVPDKKDYYGSLVSELETELPANLSQDDRKRRAEYIASILSPRAVNKGAIGDLYRYVGKSEDSKYTTKYIGEKSVRLESPVDIFNKYNKGSNLSIYYSDPLKAKYLLRFENVYFTEVSQQISQAGAEGSSEPLYEIYSFIASKKIIIQV